MQFSPQAIQQPQLVLSTQPQQQQVVTVNNLQAQVSQPSPSWTCVIVETILSYLFCCGPCGLLGFIMAAAGYHHNNKKMHQIAHWLAIISIIFGICEWIFLVILSIIYFTMFAVGAAASTK